MHGECSESKGQATDIEEPQIGMEFKNRYDAQHFFVFYGFLAGFVPVVTHVARTTFAPFVGITGHAQTCLFGCAFLHDQTVETFRWVFEAFLEAMGGQTSKYNHDRSR